MQPNTPNADHERRIAQLELLCGYLFALIAPDDDVTEFMADLDADDDGRPGEYDATDFDRYDADPAQSRGACAMAETPSAEPVL